MSASESTPTPARLREIAMLIDDTETAPLELLAWAERLEARGRFTFTDKGRYAREATAMGKCEQGDDCEQPGRFEVFWDDHPVMLCSVHAALEGVNVGDFVTLTPQERERIERELVPLSPDPESAE